MEKLMIHNVRKEYFRIDFSEYQLTFDDGLFSQYYYFPLFKKFRGPKLFFITSSLIQTGRPRNVFDGNHLPYVRARDYMYSAFIENKFGPFMRLDELKWIAGHEDTVIGAHSHYHDIVLTRHPLKKPLSRWKLERLPCVCKTGGSSLLNRRSKLAYRGYTCVNRSLVRRSTADWLDYVKYDTESCLSWFEKHLGFHPVLYSFPFNEFTPELVEVLKSYGFRYFFNGKSGDNQTIFNRTDIDKLIR